MFVVAAAGCGAAGGVLAIDLLQVVPTTSGGVLLLGYAFGQWTPYVEVERIASRGGADPFFVPDPAATNLPSFDTLRGIAGLRLDLSDWTALKAEYRHTRYQDTSSTLQELVLNWSWGF